MFNALQGPGADPKLWDYLPYGPFTSIAAWHRWVADHEGSHDPMFFALRDLDSAPEAEFDALAKVAAFMCDKPKALMSVVDSDRSGSRPMSVYKASRRQRAKSRSVPTRCSAMTS